MHTEVKTAIETSHRLPCIRCEGLTMHGVLARVESSDSTPDDFVQFWWQHEIVQCRGCETISFRQNAQNTEDTWHASDGTERLADHEELFPPRVPGRKPLADDYLLPFTVLGVYTEAHRAVTNGLRILAGIGIRALVESICKEKGVGGKTLEKKIDALVDGNILTKAGAEILHGTRLLGNIAAHEQAPLSEDQLNAAMEVAEHLLRTLYILPAIAANLPRRDAQPPEAETAADELAPSE